MKLLVFWAGKQNVEDAPTKWYKKVKFCLEFTFFRYSNIYLLKCLFCHVNWGKNDMLQINSFKDEKNLNP
uniref:Uncharacterized protein n=1 Tax=Anguilla anguilla TaxID=7936 RepID=A0A0E9WXM0_ANGAN